MNLEIIILIISIITLGIITSLSDITNKKISNNILGIFLIIGIILNSTNATREFLTNYYTNLSFALFVGFLLWYINFWNAGDGKLFTVFVSLIPISLVYKQNFFLYSFDAIIYTFVPIFFVFLVILLMQSKKQDFIFALKNGFKLKLILNILLAFFAFEWIIMFINNTGLKINIFTGAVFLFLIFNFLERVFSLKLMRIFYVISALRIVFDFNNIMNWSFLIGFIYQVTIFIIFNYFILSLAYFKYGQHIQIKDLKPGMNLCEKIIQKGDGYTVTADIKISLFMFLESTKDKQSKIKLKPEGLTNKNIKDIKEWNKKGLIDVDSLLIQKRIPYAPFQLIGIILFLIATYAGFNYIG